MFFFQNIKGVLHIPWPPKYGQDFKHRQFGHVVHCSHPHGAGHLRRVQCLLRQPDAGHGLHGGVAVQRAALSPDDVSQHHHEWPGERV